MLFTDETEVEMFGYNSECRVEPKPNTAHRHKDLIPTVSTVVEGLCLGFVLEPLDLSTISESTMNFSVYQHILESNAGSCVQATVSQGVLSYLPIIVISSAVLRILLVLVSMLFVMFLTRVN